MRLDDDTRAARTGLRAAALLFAPLAALCVAADVAAQPEPPAPPAPPAEPAPPPRDEAEADSTLEQARRELAEARRHLEEAAREVARRSREVARLSERSFGPAVREFRRQWIGTGQRALLGLVIMDAEDGAVVSAVTPGGPADQAGIRSGDVIVAIDGAPVIVEGETPSRVVIRRLSEIDPGDDVELRVRSNGETRVVRVETRDRGDWIIASDGPYFRLDRWIGLLRSPDPWASMELVPLTPSLGRYFGTDQGLLVVRAPDMQPAVLRDGDVILEIGGRVPRSPEHAMSILSTYEPGEKLLLTIMRDRQRQTLEINVPRTERDRDRDDRDPRNGNENEAL